MDERSSKVKESVVENVAPDLRTEDHEEWSVRFGKTYFQCKSEEGARSLYDTVIKSQDQDPPDVERVDASVARRKVTAWEDVPGKYDEREWLGREPISD